MPDLSPEKCRGELECQGWTVEVASGAGLWRLKVVRGLES